MAKFFVGQRVRVNYPPSISHGEETTVRAVGVPGKQDGHKYIGVEVSILNTVSRDGSFCIFEEHELDILSPEGAEPSTWDACLWKPEHLRTNA